MVAYMILNNIVCVIISKLEGVLCAEVRVFMLAYVWCTCYPVQSSCSHLMNGLTPDIPRSYDH